MDNGDEETKENMCPWCGCGLGYSQEPDDSGIEGEAYYYEFTCQCCGEGFTQWYNLVWAENTKD